MHPAPSPAPFGPVQFGTQIGNRRLWVGAHRMDWGELDDDMLARVLYIASRPVPWPWHASFSLVCRRWRRLCVSRRVRSWYLERAL
jgi:hypothetical protein